MRTAIGAGWHIVHLSDRVVELRKDDPVYRRFTGRDGYVRTRIEPQMSRQQALDEAIRFAQQTDAEMAKRVAVQLIPSAVSLARFRRQQRGQAHAFGIADEERKVYRP